MDLQDQIGGAQEIGLPGPRGRAPDIHTPHGAGLAQDDGAACRRLHVGVVADPNTGDAGETFTQHGHGPQYGKSLPDGAGKAPCCVVLPCPR